MNKISNPLTRQNCHLVQSGTFREHYVKNTGLMSVVKTNYMGSSEFLTIYLGRSTRRMLTNIDFYDVFPFPQYTNKEGEPMMVYAPKMFIDHISGIVDELATGSINWNLKEPCNLPGYLKGEKDVYNYADFWWDIQNDFYICFGEKNMNTLIEAQEAMREASKGDVEIGDWNKLAKYYLEANPDLSDEAKEFLKPKETGFARLLSRFKRTNQAG